MRDKRILFVGGMPRSGTTLLRDVFKTSPEIFVLNSDYCLYSNFENLNKYIRFPKDQSVESILKWYTKIISVSPLHQWNVDASSLKPFMQEASFFGFCDAMYQAIISKHTQFNNFVFKSPRLESYFTEINQRPWLKGNATNFAYIHRNPLHQTKSLKYSSFAWRKVKLVKDVASSNGLAWRDSILSFNYFKTHYRKEAIVLSYEDVLGKKQNFEEIENFFALKLNVEGALKSGGAKSSIKAFSGDSKLTDAETKKVLQLTKSAGEALYPSLYTKTVVFEIKEMQIGYAESVTNSILLNEIGKRLLKFPKSALRKIDFMYRKVKKLIKL